MRPTRLERALETSRNVRRPKLPLKPPPMIVRRCPACGSFVAAGRDPKLLELALRYHVCPESLAFASRNQRVKDK